jgi:hypothetical protein
MSQDPYGPFGPFGPQPPVPLTSPVSSVSQPVPAPRTIPMSAFVAVLTVAALLAGALVAVGARWVLVSDGPAEVRPVAAHPVVGAPKAPTVRTSRLMVAEPRRLLDTGRGRSMVARSERELRLPSMNRTTTAVLLQVSIIDAGGSGVVRVTSGTEYAPALRVGARGGQASATVVSVLGPDRSARVGSDVAGRLIVDLIGTFQSAQRSAAGRLVTTDPVPLVDLRPASGGHDIDVDLRRAAALRKAAPPSAVVLRVAGDVGAHGGSVTFGSSRADLDQKVVWSATAGDDRIRNGLLVVPTPAHRLYLHYKAGFRLRVELVGYVTGDRDRETGAGLSVPLEQQQASAVRVDTAGTTGVNLFSGPESAGVPSNRIAGALTYVSATGDAPGAISLRRPGAPRKALPDLSPGARARSALALTGVKDGRVTLTSASEAAVILTPRLLILR